MQTIDRQIVGAIIFVLLINLGYVCKGLFGGLAPSSSLPPLSEQKPGYRTVELKGPIREQGIYFVPPQTTLSGFLDMLGFKGKAVFSKKELSRVLSTGDVINFAGSAPDRSAVAHRGLQNSKRYVLDMPINLNTATAEDLALIPGIGEKTAEAIVQARSYLGAFKEIEDLLEVRGIGHKKLEAFRKYFYIEGQKAS